jgi:hypothetical protein
MWLNRITHVDNVIEDVRIHCVGRGELWKILPQRRYPQIIRPAKLEEWKSRIKFYWRLYRLHRRHYATSFLLVVDGFRYLLFVSNASNEFKFDLQRALPCFRINCTDTLTGIWTDHLIFLRQLQSLCSTYVKWTFRRVWKLSYLSLLAENFSKKLQTWVGLFNFRYYRDSAVKK